MKTPTLPIILAAVALLCTPACIAVTKSDSRYSGKRVSDAALASVKEGMTADQVRSILGEPTNVVHDVPIPSADVKTTSGKAAETKPAESRAAGAGRETWTYVATRTERKDSSVIFIIHSESIREFEERVHVSFEDGRVVKTWRQSD